MIVVYAQLRIYNHREKILNNTETGYLYPTNAKQNHQNLDEPEGHKFVKHNQKA